MQLLLINTTKSIGVLFFSANRNTNTAIITVRNTKYAKYGIPKSSLQLKTAKLAVIVTEKIGSKTIWIEFNILFQPNSGWSSLIAGIASDNMTQIGAYRWSKRKKWKPRKTLEQTWIIWIIFIRNPDSDHSFWSIGFKQSRKLLNTFISFAPDGMSFFATLVNSFGLDRMNWKTRNAK